MVNKNERMKCLFCFGTRPEAIKMASVIKEAEANGFEVIVCITGQHREMVTPFLNFFEIDPHYDLNVMQPNQNLSSLTAAILTGIDKVINECKPDLIFVQGDTTTTFASALGAFYHKVPVVHIEAGLRTGDIYSPFPEEANRKLVTSIAQFFFAPTEIAKDNLRKEGVVANVYITGNTSIDSLRMTLDRIDNGVLGEELSKKYAKIDFRKKVILVTVHRRENHGNPLQRICQALSEIALRDDIEMIVPVHMNPNVRSVVYSHLQGKKNVHLLEPLEYFDFTWLMSKAYLILTDSGGVQEEAPYLKKPILVLRENTERPEGVIAGVSKLVGNDKNSIVSETFKLLDDSAFYASFTSNTNPYGEGNSGKMLMEIIRREFGAKEIGVFSGR